MSSVSSLDGSDEDESVEGSGTTPAASGSASSGFVKRSVLGGIEAEFDAQDAGQPDDGVTAQKGARRLASRQALMGVTPQEVLLR